MNIIKINDRVAYGKKYGRFFVTSADTNLDESRLRKGINKINQKWDFYDSLEEAKKIFNEFYDFVDYGNVEDYK